MDNRKLIALTPLNLVAPLAVTIGAVTITEVADLAMASLAIRLGQDKAVAKAAAEAGIALPPPGRFQRATPYGAFWTGPQMWMVEAPIGSHDDIVAILKPLFGEAASLTDQTDAWARFRVSGTDLPVLFERLCSADLRAASAGAAIRTVIEHLGAFLLVVAADQIEILTARSSAASLHHALTTAAKSIA